MWKKQYIMKNNKIMVPYCIRFVLFFLKKKITFNVLIFLALVVKRLKETWEFSVM